MKTVRPFDILVPAVAEPEKFAVVSCDQFTSQRDYWDKLDEYVGDAPSALRLIFPEVYLEDGDYEERIRAINAAMYDYLEKGVFETLKDSYILEPSKLKDAKSDLCIMHPLPRVNEISAKVDDDPRACYFRQVENGKFIREALILFLLGLM